MRAPESRHRTKKGGERRLSDAPNSALGNRSAGRGEPRTDARGTAVTNLILSGIPDPEFQRIQPHLEFIRTGSYAILREPGEKLEYAYFPNRGLISIVTEMSDSRTLEVGVVSPAGFAGAWLAVAQNICPYRMICQPPMEGFRMKLEALQQELEAAPELEVRLARHVKFQGLRVSQVAACNRFHEIERRLARWLLASQDRVGGTLLPFTHEFLAGVLGTGRASISIAAAMLQHAGLIEYQRGSVKIRNRKGLESAACECYRIIRQFEAESSENGNLF